MAKVYIGVGHGGDDPGACANGFKEKDLNLKVAKACYDYLKSNGVSTLISRTSDVTESVNTKANEADNNGCTHVVDVHFNAGGGDGAEVLYYPGSSNGQTMGNNILNEIKALGQGSRGTKATDDFAMLRDTNGVANIVECAFVDNKTDMAIADTDAELKNMGVAIAKGIMKTIGVSTSSSKPIPTPTLKKGMYDNKEVKELQSILGGLTIDGDFGDKTYNALKSWQSKYGLTADGIYGEKTEAKMHEVY